MEDLPGVPGAPVTGPTGARDEPWFEDPSDAGAYGDERPSGDAGPYPDAVDGGSRGAEVDERDVAPPVVAVVVTCDSGPWLEECLAALAVQDYPNLSILVVDSGSSDDVTSRVAAVLPSAYVRRLERNVGFGPAANEVLTMVEGASHFLFCHDDVAPAPDAVRLLVEEAFRSNAGVVAPKLVAWDDPARLLSVGMAVDKSGTPSPVIDVGEIDQEQHDSVRDIFLAPGGCTLVRADLFSSLGGFDPEIPVLGEDLDLSWRTQIVGARVLVAPAARVRHVEAMATGRRPLPGTPGHRRDRGVDAQTRAFELAMRHRLRTLLVCYSLLHLLRVLPQVIVLNVGEAVYAATTGRRPTALAVGRAWRWNLGRFGEVRRRRSRVRRSRTLRDRDLRRLQVRGSARIIAFARSRLGPNAETRLWDASRKRFSASVPSGRSGIAVWSALVVVLLVGTRGLLFGGLPQVGDLVAFPDGPGAFLRQYVSGWRLAGVGSESPAPPAFGLLGLAGVVALGAMGLLQKLLVLGAIPAGILGIYRMARPLGSPRARLVAVVVYAAVPLPYGALANASWPGLLAYGAAPWVLHRMATMTRLEPFVGRVRPPWPTGLRLGIAFALLAAVAPSLPVMFLAAALLLAFSGLVVGPARLAGAPLPRVALAVVVAAVLLFPWSLELLAPGGSLAGLFGVERAAAHGLSLGEAMRFESGPIGAPPLGWALPVAAALPLVIGRGWRLAWAGRLWVIAVGSWLLAWAGGRGWAGIPMPAPEVWLAPAAVAVAISAGLGLVAFQLDLPGYRFGWRQGAVVVAGIAVVAGTLPLLGGAVDGRWGLPGRDYATVLSWMDAAREDAGDFRVLWLGDSTSLPADGWSLGDGVAYATSRNGTPDATGLWAPADEGASGLLADAVNLARRERTTRLGHLLAPMSVRYIAVTRRLAPGAGPPDLTPSADLIAGLAAQTDLKQVSGDDALVVYENAAWAPMRARVDEQQVDAAAGSGLDAASQAELTGAPPVLRRDRSPYRFQGDAGSGPGGVFHSEARGGGWQLTVDGERVSHEPAFGWAMVYPDAGSGSGTLRYRTGLLRYAAVVLQVLLWAAAVVLVRRSRAIGEHAAGGVAP